MIKIICVGKIKENYLQEAIDEYLKRLRKYTKIEVIELRDEGFAEANKAKKIEGDKILKKLSSKDYVITLEINGNQLYSQELASFIDKKLIDTSDIVFVIGGSYGLSNEVIKRANYHLSFSKMTFPHQLFRLLLLEQIYRSFKINNNESYHK